MSFHSPASSVSSTLSSCSSSSDGSSIVVVVQSTASAWTTAKAAKPELVVGGSQTSTNAPQLKSWKFPLSPAPPPHQLASSASSTDAVVLDPVTPSKSQSQARMPDTPPYTPAPRNGGHKASRSISRAFSKVVKHTASKSVGLDSVKGGSRRPAPPPLPTSFSFPSAMTSAHMTAAERAHISEPSSDATMSTSNSSGGSKKKLASALSTLVPKSITKPKQPFQDVTNAHPDSSKPMVSPLKAFFGRRAIDNRSTSSLTRSPSTSSGETLELTFDAFDIHAPSLASPNAPTFATDVPAARSLGAGAARRHHHHQERALPPLPMPVFTNDPDRPGTTTRIRTTSLQPPHAHAAGWMTPPESPLGTSFVR